jgi:hypothetical protein
MGAAAAASSLRPTGRASQAANRTKSERSTVKSEPPQPRSQITAAAPPVAAPQLLANPYAYATTKLEPSTGAAAPAQSLSLHAAGADSNYAASILGVPAPAKIAAVPAAPAVSFHAVSAAGAQPAVAHRVGGQSLSIGAANHTIAAPSAAAPRAGPFPGAAAASAARPASTLGVVPPVPLSAAAAAAVTVQAPTTVFNPLTCPECPPEAKAEVIVDPHQGVEVCTSCGLIVGTVISDESEWRTFSDRRGDDPVSSSITCATIGLLAAAMCQYASAVAAC